MNFIQTTDLLKKKDSSWASELEMFDEALRFEDDSWIVAHAWWHQQPPLRFGHWDEVEVRIVGLWPNFESFGWEKDGYSHVVQFSCMY